MGQTYILVFAVSVVIVVYSIGAPFLFKYFYPLYEPYYWWSIIFNFSFVTLLSVLYLSYFIKEQRSDIIKKTNIWSSIFLVICSFLLIMNFGLVGAIIGRMAYRFFYLFMNLVFVKKIIK